jgi:ABC-type transport system, involved in lipoprotein release, permease component
MNVMRSFTLRSLKRNKKRTIVTIIGVIISVAMITAVSTLMSSFVNYLQQGVIADSGNWHAQIVNLPVENLDAVTESDKVDVAVLSREVGYAQIPDSQNYSKSYLYLREYSENGFDQMSIRLKEGRLPRGSGEVLISRSILEGSDLGYAVGDTIMLTVGDIIDAFGKPLSGNDYASDAYDEEGNLIASPTFEPRETVTLSVVGVMETPGFEAGWSTGYGVLGYLDEAALAPGARVDVYVTVPNVSRGIYDDVGALVADAGDDRTGAEFNDDLLRFYGVVEWDNVNTFLNGFMFVIILIIVIASVSLIYNAFAMSVSERARQLGLLASVGATRRQKRASVYFEGLFVGAIGIPVGILAGLGGIGVTLAAIQPLLDSFINMSDGVKLTLVVPFSAIALTVLFSVITIFISVYKPARRASKITPIDAIRQTQEVRLTRRGLRTSRLSRRVFGFEGEIALKNLKRSRKKYRATVVSLVISLVLFLTVSSYADITGSFTDAVNDGYNFDLVVYYQNISDAQREETDARIATLELVDDFSANSLLYGFTRLSDGQVSEYAKQYIAQPEGIPEGYMELSVSLIGLDDASFEAYAKAVGVNAQDYMDAQRPKAILINYGQGYAAAEGNNIKKVAGDVLNAKAGDTLTFAGGSSEAPMGTDTEFTLGAVTQERPMGVLTGGFSAVTLIVAQRAWDAVADGLSAEETAQLASEGHLNHSTCMTADADQQLEAQLNELTQSLPASGYYIYNIKDMARSEQSLSTFLGVFVYGFIILISLICIANIFNTVSTNIALRRREFAMLRSVGMTPVGFNRMMRFESIFYGLKGLLWGLPISLLIALLLYNMQTDVLGMSFKLPWVSYIVAVFMILVIVLASMLYSTHRIKKENIIDELKLETF